MKIGKQVFPVVINDLLAPVFWNGCNSVANWCKFPIFDGCHLPAVLFRSLHGCPIGFSSGPLTNSQVSNHFGFGFFKCGLDHCSPERSMKLQRDQSLWDWVLLCTPKCLGNIQVSRCYIVSRDPVQPENVCEPPSCLTVWILWFSLRTSLCFL